MNNGYDIRHNLIRHMRKLYCDGAIQDKYKYNIHDNTITLLIGYLQKYHNEVKSVQDINFNVLKDFLKHLCENGTQKSFISIHRDVVNMEFNMNITAKDLRETKNVYRI